MGIKIESVFSPDYPIVSMVEYQGTVYVATQRHVYRMSKDDLTGTVAFDQVVFHQAVEVP
jgi:hypothetical protein